MFKEAFPFTFSFAVAAILTLLFSHGFIKRWFRLLVIMNVKAATSFAATTPKPTYIVRPWARLPSLVVFAGSFELAWPFFRS